MELKERFKALATQRDRVEQEIAVASAQLEAAGVGLNGPLVDKEGFPAANVDLYAVRADRQKIAVLTNDHKRLSAEIDAVMAQIYAQSKARPSG